MKKLNNTYRLMRTLVVMFALSAFIPAKAELTCPDAGLLSGKLLTDVCWSCIFSYPGCRSSSWLWQCPKRRIKQVILLM